MKKNILLRFRLLRPLMHAILIAVIFWWAYGLRHMTDGIPWRQIELPPIDQQELLIYTWISIFLYVSIWFINKLYELQKPLSHYSHKFLRTRGMRFVIITFIAYFGQGYLFSSGISRLIIIRVAIFSLILLALFDFLRNKWDRRLERRQHETILFVYKNKQEYEQLTSQMKRYKQYECHGCSFNELNKTDINDYHTIIMVGSYTKNTLQQAFERIRLASKRFFHIAEWFFLEDIIYKPQRIGWVIAFEYLPSALDGRAVVLKRLFDVIVAVIAIIILSPLLLIVAIAIRIDSRGPVFYLQQRIGKNGRVFTFIKFRSMFVDQCVGEQYGGQHARKQRQKLINSDKNIRKGTLQKIKDDPRVTRVWKFIRKTSIDELPNLFSVITGKMSLIGPRPHMPHEVAQYKPRQKRLLSIKPGITWYAQIFGRDELSFEEEAQLELTYIQNRTIFLDLYIIIATLHVLVIKRDT